MMQPQQIQAQPNTQFPFAFPQQQIQQYNSHIYNSNKMAKDNYDYLNDSRAEMAKILLLLTNLHDKVTFHLEQQIQPYQQNSTSAETYQYIIAEKEKQIHSLEQKNFELNEKYQRLCVKLENETSNLNMPVLNTRCSLDSPPPLAPQQIQPSQPPQHYYQQNRKSTYNIVMYHNLAPKSVSRVLPMNFLRK